MTDTDDNRAVTNTASAPATTPSVALAVHRRFEAGRGKVSGIVLLSLADFGVQHVIALE